MTYFGYQNANITKLKRRKKKVRKESENSKLRTRSRTKKTIFFLWLKWKCEQSCYKELRKLKVSSQLYRGVVTIKTGLFKWSSRISVVPVDDSFWQCEEVSGFFYISRSKSVFFRYHTCSCFSGKMRTTINYDCWIITQKRDCIKDWNLLWIDTANYFSQSISSLSSHEDSWSIN